MSITEAYRTSIENFGLIHDDAQQQAVAALQELQQPIVAAYRLPRRLRRRLPWMRRDDAPRGLYLWGGVGRGKTFLMDLFFETLAVDARRRVHFHRLMSGVHAHLAQLRHVGDPLDAAAAAIAADARVLCFDEFFVSDIGDAMILGRLLDGLFRRGVVLVTTSNVPPGDLYRGGLQRDRFAPAIALLRRHTQVLELAGVTDYRLRLLESAGTYLEPAGSRADARLEQYFRRIAAGKIEDEAGIKVAGRPLCSRRRATGVIWFEFDELCRGPRSQEDYIELARWYPTVILSNVPVMNADDDDAARRFVSLVDEFHDRRVKLLISAAAAIDKLYAGRRLAFEFERTASRLVEMQSTAYLHAPHLA